MVDIMAKSPQYLRAFMEKYLIRFGLYVCFSR